VDAESDGVVVIDLARDVASAHRFDGRQAGSVRT
jgi:hypothetical protein